MKQLFDKYDRDHNGTLDRTELMQGFKNVFSTYAELDAMISKYDANHDGLVSFDEFMQLLAPESISEETK